MRGFDRDLIRGGHYGQRPGVPRSKAEHMAAPTNAAGVKKVLANLEPSTHGPSQRFAGPTESQVSAVNRTIDLDQKRLSSAATTS
jgi:hypothetical protein